MTTRAEVQTSFFEYFRVDKTSGGWWRLESSGFESDVSHVDSEGYIFLGKLAYFMEKGKHFIFRKQYFISTLFGDIYGAGLL